MVHMSKNEQRDITKSCYVMGTTWYKKREAYRIKIRKKEYRKGMNKNNLKENVAFHKKFGTKQFK